MQPSDSFHETCMVSRRDQDRPRLLLLRNQLRRSSLQRHDTIVVHHLPLKSRSHPWSPSVCCYTHSEPRPLLQPSTVHHRQARWKNGSKRRLSRMSHMGQHLGATVRMSSFTIRVYRPFMKRYQCEMMALIDHSQPRQLDLSHPHALQVRKDAIGQSISLLFPLDYRPMIYCYRP